MDSFNVYKIEASELSAVYIYKKDADGKLHLSYHNRTRTGKLKLNASQKVMLKRTKNEIKEAYKHEVYVLGVQRNGKIVNKPGYKSFKEDIGDNRFNYNPKFWENFNIPPATTFYKKVFRN